jgi:hypothetical protein
MLSFHKLPFPNPNTMFTGCRPPCIRMQNEQSPSLPLEPSATLFFLRGFLKSPLDALQLPNCFSIFHTNPFAFSISLLFWVNSSLLASTLSRSEAIPSLTLFSEGAPIDWA